MHRMLRTTILITFGMLIICIICGCADDPPKEVTDPPQSGTDIRLPSATKVVVDPAARNRWPPGVILPNTEFTLTFNEEVVAVTVNDTPTSGSGLTWKWNVQPHILPYGSLTLKIIWTNRNGSRAFARVGPYEVAEGHPDPPVIMSGTVSDGSNDVNPALINASGLRYDFDEDVTGTIKLTDEAGADLNWQANVSGRTATLTVIAGQELVNETTYKVEFDISDGAGNPLATKTITFVTKPK